MSTQSDPESFQIKLGQDTIKLLQFRESKSSGDVYGWFGIPEVGLHFSSHKPRPPLHPNVHLHLKSNSLGIHEDIVDFDPSDIVDSFQNFTEGLIDEINEPEPDESVMMLPLSTGTFSSGTIHILNIIESLTGNYYRTRGSRLSDLIANKPQLQGTIGISDEGLILPFDKDSIYKIPFKPNLDSFNTTFMGKSLNAFADPLTRALEIIQRNSPSSLTKWIPPSTVGSFMQETQSLIKTAKPQIIDF